MPRHHKHEWIRWSSHPDQRGGFVYTAAGEEIKPNRCPCGKRRPNKN